MYESPGSHFSKITTGIHSVPDTFHELRFAMTFLTLMGVTEPLCGFTLVLERKTGKKIPELSRLDFLEKFLANNFALSDAEDDTSVLLNTGGVADSSLLRTLLAIHQKYQEPSDRIFCFICICKFGSFKNPFAMINSLSELYFRFRSFILLVETKKVISMNYGSWTSS